jgi:galactokinase
LQPLGPLFAASVAGRRDLYEISVIAAPQAGAGFGGCLVALVEVAQAERFAEYVTEAYARTTGIQPSVYTVQASEGAGDSLDD